MAGATSDCLIKLVHNWFLDLDIDIGSSIKIETLVF